MGDAACMLRSAQICHQRASFLVVVSATSGTTNLLIELGQKAEKGLWADVEKNLMTLKTKHLKIAADLKTSEVGFSTLNTLLEEMASIAK